MKWFSKRNFLFRKTKNFPKYQLLKCRMFRNEKLLSEYQLLKRRCVCMSFFNFQNFWFFSKLFFFICVLIFSKFRRDHYFLRGQLMANMHLWKRHGINTQKRWHSMLSNRSFSCRGFHFGDFDTISFRTIKGKKARLNQM